MALVVSATKVAVTVVAAATVTVHGRMPMQPPPLQPANTEPVAGVAVRITLVLALKAPPHVAPQSMPAGLEVAVPLPVPAFVTVSGKVCKVKVAVTLRAWVMVTEHVPVPPQPSPLQPAKVE